MNVLSRFGHLLGITPLPADVAEELAALRQHVTDLTCAQADFAQTQVESQQRIAALRDAIEKLDKQTARAGKEQFKSNSLAETQQQSLKTILEQLREANGYRERELAQLRDQLVTARAEGRLDVIKRLLPVLDGLREALAAGQRWRAEPAALSAATGPTAPPVPLTQRLSSAWQVLTGTAAPDPLTAPPSASSNREEVTAWLTGLELVHARLLDILASEGIQPIETEGATFDPNYHVAIEAVAATESLPPGAILQETRRGYTVGSAVLRYAEVIVAR